VTAKRILRHPRLDRRGKPVKAFAHIGSTGRQPYACARLRIPGEVARESAMMSPSIPI
jgi:hypothetical protein